jgi:hypothetical protein
VRKYRLLCARAPHGHMSLEREFEAEDRLEAISLAEGWRDQRPAELWTAKYTVIQRW